MEKRTMPGTVSIGYLGDLEQEKTVYALIENYLDECPEDWTVSLLGNQQSTIWELKVAGPPYFQASLKKLHWEDGGHFPLAILDDLKQVIRTMRGTPNVAQPATI
jgi:hypothetical protein